MRASGDVDVGEVHDREGAAWNVGEAFDIGKVHEREGAAWNVGEALERIGEHEDREDPQVEVV